MYKKLLFHYLMDRKSYITLYLFTTCILIFYFHTISSITLTLIYPLLISLLPLLLFLIIDSIKYIRFNQRIVQNIQGQPIELIPLTYEQEIVNELFTNMSIHGSNQYQQLKLKYRDYLYFSSHLMHHLKAPLAVIDIVLADESDIQELRTIIKEQSNRMNRTVTQALSIIRSDAFEKDLTIEAVELISLVNVILNELKIAYEEAQIEPIISCNEPEFFIISDKKWLKVCIEQLVSNAIKYSKPKNGRKKLHITIEKQEKTIALHIADEGIGIPTYDQNRIFEPFFTGENGRFTLSSSGIGLYLCKKICQQLNHQLSFHTKQYEGTCFTLQFKKSKKHLTNM